MAHLTQLSRHWGRRLARGPRRWLRRGSVPRAALGAISAGLVGQLALMLSGVIFARELGPQGRVDVALLLLLPAVVFHFSATSLPRAAALTQAIKPIIGLLPV